MIDHTLFARRIADPRSFLRELRKAEAVFALGGTVTTWWGGPSLDREAFRRTYRDTIDALITRRGGTPTHWRKLDDAYQTEQMRDCRAIRDTQQRRVRLYYLGTPELRRRFGHLRSSHQED